MTIHSLSATKRQASVTWSTAAPLQEFPCISCGPFFATYQNGGFLSSIQKSKQAPRQPLNCLYIDQLKSAIMNRDMDYEDLLNKVTSEHDGYINAIDGMNDSIEALFKTTRKSIVSKTGGENKKDMLDAYKRTHFSMLNLDGLEGYNFQKETKYNKKGYLNSTVLDKISLADDSQEKYEIDRTKLKDLIDEHLIKTGLGKGDPNNENKKQIEYMVGCFTTYGNSSLITDYLSKRTNIHLKKSKTERILLIYCFKFYGFLINMFLLKKDLDEGLAKSFARKLRSLVNELPITLDTKTQALKMNMIFFVKIFQLGDVSEMMEILGQIEKSGIVSKDVVSLTTYFENYYYAITPQASRQSSLQYFVEAGLETLIQVDSEIDTKRKRNGNAHSNMDTKFDLLNDNQFSVQLELPSYLTNFHESLTCPIDQSEMNLLANPAIILSCGHIFGQSTVKKLLENFVPNHELPYYGENIITCPYCNVGTSEEGTRAVHYINIKEAVFENFVDYFI